MGSMRTPESSPPKRRIEVEETQMMPKKRAQPADPMRHLRQHSRFGWHLDTVTFVIGTHAVPFVVHTGLLIARSPTIAETLLPHDILTQSVAASGAEVRLANEDARTFWIFMVWLYTGKLVAPPQGLSTKAAGVEERNGAVQKRLVDGESQQDENEWLDEDLVDIYYFGQRFRVHTLSNLAITKLLGQNKKLGRTVSAKAAAKVFSKVTSQGLINKYLVEEAELRLREKRLNVPDDTSAFHHTYVSRLLREVLDQSSMAKQSPSQITTGCRYHSHEGTDEQKACERQQKNAESAAITNSNIYGHLQDIGVVLVGPNLIPFTVHKGLICSGSDFFRGAFEGQFIEGRTKEVTLVHESPALFAMFLHWLYQQELVMPEVQDRRGLAKLEDPSHTRNGNDDGDVDKAQLSVAGAGDNEGLLKLDAAAKDAGEGSQAFLNNNFQDDLVNMYIFADRRGIRTLRTAIMDLLITKRQSEKTWPLVSSSLDRINVAWTSLPDSSGLCLYLIDEAAWLWNKDVAEVDGLGQLPSEFLGSVVKTMLLSAREKRSSDMPSLGSAKCKYHEHEDDEARSRCQGQT